MGATAAYYRFASLLGPARRYRFLPYYSVLRLAQSRALRQRVLAWIAAQEPAAVAAWLDLLADLPEACRVRVAAWAEQGGRLAAPPAPEWGVVLRLVKHLDAAKQPDLCEHIGKALDAGTDVAFIEAWLRLRIESGRFLWLGTPAQGAALPLDRIRALNPGPALPAVYYLCRGGGADFLGEPGLALLGPAALEFICDAASRSRPVAQALLRALLALPTARQEELIHTAGPALSWSNMTAAQVTAVLARWDAGLSKAAVDEWVLWIDELPPRWRDAAVALPAACVAAMGKAGGQTPGGVRAALCRYAPDLAVEFLRAGPRHLAELGAWLNACGTVRARNLLDRARRHPLFASAPEGAALVAFDNFLLAHRAFARRLPEFVTWDRHFAGAKPLKAAAIGDVAARIHAKIPLMQMWWLQEEVRAELLRVHPDENAARLYAGLASNRRPLLRFLRRHAAAEVDQRLDHAVNRRWLHRMSTRLRLDAWLHAPALVFTVEGFGRVTIAPETDPLEILRMGTYVDSCFAAGGYNAHAVVAVLLDANKRVLFARDAQGKFLARQVAAVAEDARLVCYGVYPANRPAPLEDAFAAYVTEWAARLGAALADNDEDVKPLAVARWYDDGVWSRLRKQGDEVTAAAAA
ncbi:MAG: hypothetical protein IT162_19410 [Bryobacterales bacterium]|nr:hypothetical protein [Bryobacterales bacterium]